ncbi:MAG TPA: SRPBCC family protein [Jatrophihabitans sp.]|nr:SRPBCC family protein [Jatrophihabitans sp.]
MTSTEEVTLGSSDASSSVEIAATPERVYALITDLAVLAELAEETATMRWVSGDTAAPGSVFRGANRNGWRRWSTRCTVTAAEPGRCFGFDVVFPPGLPVSRWQYDLEATPAGCRVTETTWDHRSGLFAALSGLATGVSDRGQTNAEHIEATLARLKARAESS